MTVAGFLPTIYAQNGLRGIWPGVLTAVVGGLGAAGSIGTGPFLQRGVPVRALLIPAFAAMAVTSVLTFAVNGRRRPAPGSGCGTARTRLTALGCRPTRIGRQPRISPDFVMSAHQAGREAGRVRHEDDATPSVGARQILQCTDRGFPGGITPAVTAHLSAWASRHRIDSTWP